MITYKQVMQRYALEGGAALSKAYTNQYNFYKHIYIIHIL